MNLNFDTKEALSSMEGRIKNKKIPPSVTVVPAPVVSAKAQVAGIKLVVDREIAKVDQRIDHLEALIPTKGNKGDKGDKGDKGNDGRNGVDGAPGRDGKDGKAGKNGKDGIDGVSVVDTYVAADGNLVMKLSNGNEIDAGNLDPLNAGSTMVAMQNAIMQITVSATAPINPDVNSLWLDIS